jgi:DNA-binding transcriptional LysR family regulator
VELRELEYFVAVAEEASFTRGAERMHVVQSAASAAVARLERELGQQLFDRIGRHIELTEAGRTVLRHARVLLTGVRTLRDEVDELRGGLRGRVTLGTVLTTGHLDLTAIMSRFHQRHPRVTVRLRRAAGTDEDRMHQVRNGVFDLVLLPVPEQISAGVVVTPVARLELVLACRRDDPLTRTRRVRYRDLAHRDFVDFPEAWGYSAVVEALFTSRGCTRNIAFEVVDVASAIDLVRGGLGLAFLPADSLDQHPTLAAVDLDEPPAPRRLGIAVPDDRPLSSATQAMHRMITSASAQGGS